jgi:DeoR/GlpR family transcriptional regulator of sugar metabolism
LGWVTTRRQQRLDKLCKLLKERFWSLEELAERLGVSAKTVYRDLQEIQGDRWRYPLVRREEWGSEQD